MVKLAIVAALAVAAVTHCAVAADLPSPASAAVDSISWDGGYIGGSIGIGPGTLTSDVGGYPIDFSGMFLGAQAGYNLTLGEHLVLGVEGDFNLTNEQGSYTRDDPAAPPFLADTYVDNFKLDWTGAVTGHVGYAVENVMPYLLAGIAFAHGSEDYSYTAIGGASPYATGTSQGTSTGYTVGAGLAAMLGSNLSGFVEGRYSNYGATSYPGSSTPGPYTLAGHLSDTTVKVGMNYHF